MRGLVMLGGARGEVASLYHHLGEPGHEGIREVTLLFIDALRRGASPIIEGDGHQTRDFTYVADVVRANLLAAAAPAERCSGRVYNVAGGRACNILELLGTCARLLDVEARPRFTDSRPGDVRASQADLSAARADLSYEPTVRLEEGLALTLAGMDENVMSI